MSSPAYRFGDLHQAALLLPTANRVGVLRCVVTAALVLVATADCVLFFFVICCFIVGSPAPAVRLKQRGGACLGGCCCVAVTPNIGRSCEVDDSWWCSFQVLRALNGQFESARSIAVAAQQQLSSMSPDVDVDGDVFGHIITQLSHVIEIVRIVSAFRSAHQKP